MAIDLRNTTITYLGHSTFRIRTPGGKSLLIDPWVMNNPACPEGLKKVDSLDVMLVTHGHFDHIGDAVAIAQDTKARVVAVYETTHWLKGKGVENTREMNKGATRVVDGIKATMVHADHSCGILDEGKIIYGGEACGYVVEMENGFKIYHAGDTNVFGDMRIIAELYEPDLVMLPIGDLYTMSPREAAYACRLLGGRPVVPMHFGTFPALTGTPGQLRELVADLPRCEVMELKPGQTLS